MILYVYIPHIDLLCNGLKNKEGQNPAQAANPAIFQQNMMGQNFQPKINQVSFNSSYKNCYRKISYVISNKRLK